MKNTIISTLSSIIVIIIILDDNVEKKSLSIFSTQFSTRSGTWDFFYWFLVVVSHPPSCHGNSVPPAPIVFHYGEKKNNRNQARVSYRRFHLEFHFSFNLTKCSFETYRKWGDELHFLAKNSPRKILKNGEERSVFYCLVKPSNR